MSDGSQYHTRITATTSGSQAVSFVVSGATGVSLRARNVVVKNAGSSSDVYFNFTSTSGASTGDYPIVAGATFTLTARKGAFYSGLSCIAAASTSSSVAIDILAYR